jgi:CRISPR type I-E-associated protein CasB/Cse2
MKENSFDPHEAGKQLLAHLRQHRQDRGALANLRGALKPAQRHRAWPYLGRVGIGNPRYEVVAGLFAHHPDGDDSQAGNLGATCRRLAGENNTFDGRFRRLLTCDREEVCERIVPVVFAAKAKGVRVNYERLFADLTYWTDRTREEWAREYWGGAEPVATEQEATA